MTPTTRTAAAQVAFPLDLRATAVAGFSHLRHDQANVSFNVGWIRSSPVFQLDGRHRLERRLARLLSNRPHVLFSLRPWRFVRLDHQPDASHLHNATVDLRVDDRSRVLVRLV